MQSVVIALTILCILGGVTKTQSTKESPLVQIVPKGNRCQPPRNGEPHFINDACDSGRLDEWAAAMGYVIRTRGGGGVA